MTKDEEIEALKAALAAAERRVRRYQVAHCRLMQLVSDLAASEGEIDGIAANARRY